MCQCLRARCIKRCYIAGYWVLLLCQRGKDPVNVFSQSNRAVKDCQGILGMSGGGTEEALGVAHCQNSGLVTPNHQVSVVMQVLVKRNRRMPIQRVSKIKAQ